MPRTPSAPESGTAEHPEETVDLARRRLLSAGKYVAPAIVGIIVLQSAGCQPKPSCVPNVRDKDAGICGPDLCPPAS